MLLLGDFVLPNRELTGAVTIEDILSHRAGIPSCDNASLSWGGKSKSDHSAISPLVLSISLSTFLQSDGTKLLTFLAGDHADTPAVTTRKLRHFPLSSNTALASLRTRSIYSNTMCTLAQDLIETLLNQPLSNVLKEQNLDILNMKRSFFGWHDITNHAKMLKLIALWDTDRSPTQMTTVKVKTSKFRAAAPLSKPVPAMSYPVFRLFALDAGSDRGIQSF